VTIISFETFIFIFENIYAYKIQNIVIKLKIRANVVKMAKLYSTLESFFCFCSVQQRDKSWDKTELNIIIIKIIYNTQIFLQNRITLRFCVRILFCTLVINVYISIGINTDLCLRKISVFCMFLMKCGLRFKYKKRCQLI